MIKKVPMEINQNNATGSICFETGTYCCNMHLSSTKIVYKGDEFPKCDQRGGPHSTIWNKLLN